MVAYDHALGDYILIKQCRRYQRETQAHINVDNDKMTMKFVSRKYYRPYAYGTYLAMTNALIVGKVITKSIKIRDCFSFQKQKTSITGIWDNISFYRKVQCNMRHRHVLLLQCARQKTTKQRENTHLCYQ